MQFKIEQIAIAPRNAIKAVQLMMVLGLTDWINDDVAAAGTVWGAATSNEAQLSFNYQAAPTKPLELEMLQYKKGLNWLDLRSGAVVSHIGMHVSEGELEAWRVKLDEIGIKVAQEVLTYSHSNPNIAGKRWYKYVIFSTYEYIGCDLKFILRRDQPPQAR